MKPNASSFLKYIVDFSKRVAIRSRIAIAFAAFWGIVSSTVLAQPPADDKEDAPSSSSSNFTKGTSSWGVGLYGGYPILFADYRNNINGLAAGLEVRKSLGYLLSLDLEGFYGQMAGVRTSSTTGSELVNNLALNGTINPTVDYRQSRTFENFKSVYYGGLLKVTFHLGNISFRREAPKLGLFLNAGGGAMLYNAKTDQLDASGNMYDFSTINASGSSITKDDIRAVQDGDFESDLESRTGKGGATLYPLASAGFGLEYHLNTKLSLKTQLEVMYAFDDNLDGRRWATGVSFTQGKDMIATISIGAHYRLGKDDDVSWMKNPLELPYKELAEAKEKLRKVDDLDKKVEEMDKTAKETRDDVEALKKDEDGDGISDFFDKETGSPSGAIVDGSGRTIMYKDPKTGDMIFVDPTAGDDDGEYAPEDLDPETGEPKPGAVKRKKNASGGWASDGSGGSGTGGTGSTSGGTGGNKKSAGNNNVKKWDPSATKGRVALISSDGKGGYSGAMASKMKNKSGDGYSDISGIQSSAGFLPAVFFTTNSSKIDYKYYPYLYEIATALEKNPNMKIEVRGYTDFRGTERFNSSLAKSRSDEVIKALEQYFGVPKGRLIPVAKGESDPLNNLKNKDALQANRRVEFIPVGEEGKLESAPPVKAAPAPSKMAPAKKPAVPESSDPLVPEDEDVSDEEPMEVPPAEESSEDW